ncbi:MAG TPA: uroporphyrinogen-III synthase, partial [Gemmatimonadaceae bacterium]|nr:uroporphyrinogen-III synthase [Gemmatimonadaceae bacterium]
LEIVRRIDDPQLRVAVEAERAAERTIANSSLRGKRVLVTRPEAQAGAFCDALEAEGAVPVRLSLHRMEPVRARSAPWAEIASYDWIIFTSANGVSFGWASAPADARAALTRHAGIAVVGPATALAARNCGMQVRLVAPTHMAESLADALGDPTHQRILWVRGTEARDVLGPTLRQRGASLDEQIVYRPVPIEADGDLRARLQDIDIVTLTSPSAVRRFVELAGRDAHGRVACIGPVTAAAARDAGLQVQAVADPYTIPGLMQALRSMTARDHD